MFCRQCGKEITHQGAFCGFCGARIAAPAPTAPPTGGQGYSDPQWGYGQQPKKKAPRPWWKKPEVLIIGGTCLILLLFAVILLIVLGGGAEPEPSPLGIIDALEEPEVPTVPDKPEESEEPDPAQEPEEPEEPTGPLVTDAFFDDSHLTSYGSGIFAIPQINLDSEEIRSLNEEIYREIYTNLVEDLLENWDDRQNGGEEVTYVYYEAGDVLSLVIEVHPVSWEWTDYYVYNVSVSEGRMLSDDEVIAQSGVEDFRKTVKQALETYFWESYPAQDTFMGDFYNEQLDRTRAQSNINEAVPYLNDDGELCVIAPIYSLAGAAYYLHSVNLEDFEYQSWYSGYPGAGEGTSDEADYIIADSDTRRISESELYSLSEHESWLALNEIYARHGRLFAREEFANYFNSKSWYNGYIDGTVFDSNLDSYLSSIEQENIATIVAYQKKMGWR